MMIEEADFEQFPNVTVIIICTRIMTADVDSIAITQLFMIIEIFKVSCWSFAKVQFLVLKNSFKKKFFFDIKKLMGSQIKRKNLKFTELKIYTVQIQAFFFSLK